MNKCRNFALVAAGFALAGCGGGGGGAASSGGAAATALVGANLVTSSTLLAATLRQSTGSEAPDGALTLDDGYVFVSADGFVAGTASEDGSTGVLTEVALTGSYDTRAFGDGTYANSTVPYGVSGPKVSGDLSGGGSWSGEGFLTLRPAAGAINDLGVGAATLSADFTTNRADAMLSGFAGPIETVTIDGMSISGDRFTGGSFAYFSGGAEIDLTGANTSHSSQGVFTGDVQNGLPDEAAGVFISSGDLGAILGGFVVD